MKDNNDDNIEEDNVSSVTGDMSKLTLDCKKMKLAGDDTSPINISLVTQKAPAKITMIVEEEKGRWRGIKKEEELEEDKRDRC